MYMEKLHDIFGFTQIKDSLKRFAKTEKSRFLIESLPFITDYDLLKEKLDLLTEVDSFLFRYGPLPLNHSFNLSLVLEGASKGLILTPSDFDHILSDINAVSKTIVFARERIEQSSLLGILLAQFNDLSTLKTAIEKVINPNLSIKDNASPELSKIRRELFTTEQKISRLINELSAKYASVMSDNLVTIRNGHYVIPVKVSEKNNVDGIIHDISLTGQTVYIEPSPLVAINNKLLSLKSDEHVEINRILRNLTSLTLIDKVSIIQNNDIIGQLDFNFAKAQYGQSLNGHIAVLSKEQVIDFKDAAHPLIDKNKVVRNSFLLNDENRLILISGPNAGGKTVVLKTIALLVLMNQAGLMLPTTIPAKIGLFNNIYADIGDAQSLSDNLSTFSGHIKNLASFVDIASSQDLVLIDELGTGTDPSEGEVLAKAIIEVLVKNKVTALISSHFSKLKAYIVSLPNVSNGSMMFDETNLTPMYKYVFGLPGKSYGLIVAKKYGLNNEIIESAKKDLDGQSTIEFENVIAKLQTSLKTADDKTLVLNKKIIELNKKEAENAQLQNKLNKRLSTIDAEAKELIDQKIAEANQKIDHVLKQAYEENLKPHHLIALKKALETDNTNNIENDKEGELELNDYVYIKTLEVEGEIISIKGNRLLVKTTMGITVNAKKTDVVKTAKPKEEKKKAVMYTKQIDDTVVVKLELNIIGLRVDEAMPQVKAYLDKCLAKRFSTVRIIHGFGSGALRKAVHDYLKKQSFVKSYALGGQYDGGGGATIVNL